jgi:hypothetical protein
MARTKVNNEYFHTGWLLAFTVDPNVVVNEPLPFRYTDVKKGEFKGSQIIQGWLNVDKSKVIKTDEELDMKVKYKFLETKDRHNVMIARIPVTLENGIYDPVFGLPFPGEPEDARSIDFVTVKPNTEYQFNLLGVDANEGVINVLQFDENDATTAAVDLVEYNQTLTLEIDTVKVKVWASDILVDSSDVPITDYQIGEQVLKYVFGAEVLNIQVETIENQKYGIIRGRTDTNVTVLQLS